ncbi:MAG: L-glutamate gamma-semialdehyde dehydrogenase [Cyclobacteriaceae bacterium]
MRYPLPKNEAVLSYSKGSQEREAVAKELEKVYRKVKDIPMVIGGREIRSTQAVAVKCPHNHSLQIGTYYKGDGNDVKQAIECALEVKEDWKAMSLDDRAAIFEKAADLLAGPWRQRVNAATMACQSKNIYQAEIDASCELIDFLRLNVAFAKQIYAEQPVSVEGIQNSMEYRPLEGFVFAITPFNFTSIAANLCCAPALMGNTVVWKPADSQIYSAYGIMELLKEAGLPDGVINLVYADGPEAGEVVFNDPDFAGLHFTGSSTVFNTLWQTISNNLSNYNSYPRIVGETGGKDFILAHESAKVDALVVALVRGAFEYQGQKCSAASRAYIPVSLWEEVKHRLITILEQIKIGDPQDLTCFMNAVIDEKAFDKITSYIEVAKKEGLELIYGGDSDKTMGYFVEPTVFLSPDPSSTTMCEEIFGPVLTIHVYEDDEFEEVLELVDVSSDYALTGAIFAEDKDVIALVSKELYYAAGNFYINDKPTGAVVGQQPFGGARASGTNDKAGWKWNLLRWTSPRTIKENLSPPTDWKYPFMKE